jgi:hypothetical protein
MRSKDHTAIYLHDDREDNNNEGIVVIHGRIPASEVEMLQQYLHDQNPRDSEEMETIARVWLGVREYDVVYPLYYEQVWI